MTQKSGPLRGMRLIEFAGLGPAPFGAMMLADMGAEVIRIDRPPSRGRGAALDQRTAGGRGDVLGRGRRSIALDLKQPVSREAALKLIDGCDALIEGFRPGVMEQMGLSPEVCLARNPKLVYARATGWGQSGPLADRAGHDINYLAINGVLHSMARHGEKPLPVPGFVGDFGGGGMLLAFGVVCALLEAARSGRGQVVDASVCDGSALLASLIYGWKGIGLWHDQAGLNMGDSGAHFYDTYRCLDGHYIAIGAIEPQFYSRLLKSLDIDDPQFARQWDEAQWPELKRQFAERFAQRTRAQWCELLEGLDVCFAPVLDLQEAPLHPHNLARDGFIDIGGVRQPAPAPRFGATPASMPALAPLAGQHTRELLAGVGYSEQAVGEMLAEGAAFAANGAVA